MKFEFNLYDPVLVKPMRDEVTSLGFSELLTDQDAERCLMQRGFSIVFINSVCGCAAGKARPGLKIAVDWAKNNDCLPHNLYTAFAGMERRAVSKSRDIFGNFPPSSPQIALLKDGILLGLIQRNEIENSDAFQVSEKIISLLKEHCSQNKKQ